MIDDDALGAAAYNLVLFFLLVSFLSFSCCKPDQAFRILDPHEVDDAQILCPVYCKNETHIPQVMQMPTTYVHINSRMLNKIQSDRLHE